MPGSHSPIMTEKDMVENIRKSMHAIADHMNKVADNLVLSNEHKFRKMSDEDIQFVMLGIRDRLESTFDNMLYALQNGNTGDVETFYQHIQSYLSLVIRP